MWNLTAFLLAGLVCLAGLYLWKRRSRHRIVDTRRRYLESVSRIERLVTKLNVLADLIEKEKLDHNDLLDAYEATTRRVEALLLTLHRIPPTACNDQLVSDIYPLLTACELKMKSLEARLREAGGDRRVYERFKRNSDPPVKGCYFCSCPFQKLSFAKIRIRLKDEKKETWACQNCRNEMKEKGELPILYFRRDGKTVHWSELEEYNPLRDFSKISKMKPEVLREPVTLSLIRGGSDSDEATRNQLH